jgi:hypothetical protein
VLNRHVRVGVLDGRHNLVDRGGRSGSIVTPRRARAWNVELGLHESGGSVRGQDRVAHPGDLRERLEVCTKPVHHVGRMVDARSLGRLDEDELQRDLVGEL